VRQGWPDTFEENIPWPSAFRESRRWYFLVMRPGEAPLKALVELFLQTWQYDATDPAWEKRRSNWTTMLLSGEASLPGLLDATERRYNELGRDTPAAFFLYIDQGEELYVRGEEDQRRCFSEMIADGLGDSRFRALMSIRSDFLGALQSDEPLFRTHYKIDVPPLREAELREVVTHRSQARRAQHCSAQ
jgi:hypothetical protein